MRLHLSIIPMRIEIQGRRIIDIQILLLAGQIGKVANEAAGVRRYH
jgi:hypothetical protein